jgi:hypothetical protein
MALVAEIARTETGFGSRPQSRSNSITDYFTRLNRANASFSYENGTQSDHVARKGQHPGFRKSLPSFTACKVTGPEVRLGMPKFLMPKI